MHGHARNILAKWLQFTILSRQSSSNYRPKTYRNIFTWSHVFNSSQIRHISFMSEHLSLWKTLFSVQRPMVVLQVGTSSPSSHILFNFISVGIQWVSLISGHWDKLRVLEWLEEYRLVLMTIQNKSGIQQRTMWFNKTAFSSHSWGYSWLAQ